MRTLVPTTVRQTNNSTKTRQVAAEKLAVHGISATAEEVVTSGVWRVCAPRPPWQRRHLA
jgi:hypothetical protein